MFEEVEIKSEKEDLKNLCDLGRNAFNFMITLGNQQDQNAIIKWIKRAKLNGTGIAMFTQDLKKQLHGIKMDSDIVAYLLKIK